MNERIDNVLEQSVHIRVHRGTGLSRSESRWKSGVRELSSLLRHGTSTADLILVSIGDSANNGARSE